MVQAESATQATAAPLQVADLEAAFQGSIDKVRVPLSYRFGIVLVAIVMILLPLIYLSIIGLVAYAVYYHATNHVGIMGSVQGRGAFMALLVYVAPLIVGGILILFMFKPLFSKPAKRPITRRLTPEEEPALFAFVDRICKAVGSPRPREIRVDCQVNASASFRRGLGSMLGNDLVLTIGMPLAAGLSLRQLAGVLAHEFGHFSQGAGMRLTFVIRSISHWFTRVVYERDSWDETLVEWSGGVDLRIGWILYLARFLVWLTRKLLWVLMMIGHTVSGYMLRQMEFDADRYEARLAGSDTFAATARRLNELNAASQQAQADLGSYYQEGRLGDDLPKLTIINVEELPTEVQQQIDEHLNRSKTGWLDTHPADKDRIASARAENAPGIFRLDVPAGQVFTDVERTSRQVTRDFYEEVFDGKVKDEDLHPIDELLRHKRQQKESFDALRRYFQDNFTMLRPLHTPGWQVPTATDVNATRDQLAARRDQVLQQRKSYESMMAEYDQADTVQIEIQQARALLAANFKVGAQDFSRALTSTAATREQEQTNLGHMNSLGGQLQPYEQAAAERLFTALGLLSNPSVQAHLPDAAGASQEVATLLPCLNLLQRNFDRTIHLRNSLAVFAVLLGNLDGNEQNSSLIEKIRGQMSALCAEMVTLRRDLDQQPYPFDHAVGSLSIGHYVLENLPPSENPGAIYEAADSTVNTIYVLTARITGRLCQIAEQVEAVLGLPPLPEPPKAEESSDETPS